MQRLDALAAKDSANVKATARNNEINSVKIKELTKRLINGIESMKSQNINGNQWK